MTTKQLTAQEQAQEDQEILAKFFKDNGFVPVVDLRTEQQERVTLQRALKDEYSGDGWATVIQVVRKNDNGNG